MSHVTCAGAARMVETLLRLRGNTIIVGTTGFPDERTFDIAVRRGVMIAEHHMTPLGLNVWGWPTGLPYTYRLDPELLQTAWRALAKYQAGRNMLWSVGMRGLWDQPFWAADPAIQSDQERGAIISACIGNQTSIIEDETGKPGRYALVSSVDPGCPCCCSRYVTRRARARWVPGTSHTCGQRC